MQWPWKRFEAFYEAFVKRHLVETLEHRKESMINGFWSNDGMNDDKGTRQEAIEELENSFQEAIQSIMRGGKKKEEEEIDKSNPFFAAMDTKLPRIEKPQANGKTVEAVIEQQQEFDHYVDQ